MRANRPDGGGEKVGGKGFWADAGPGWDGIRNEKALINQGF